MNIKNYSDKIYKANSLKELKGLLPGLSELISDNLSKNSLLTKTIQETYIKNKSFGYMGKKDGENFYKYYCPNCKKFHTFEYNVFRYFCKECDTSLITKTNEDVEIILDKNIILSGQIGMFYKNYDELLSVQSDDKAYLEYMSDPLNFDYKLNSDFVLIVYTKKHKLRIYKNNTGALLQFNKKSGINLVKSNKIKLDLFNKKDEVFKLLSDEYEVNKDINIFDNLSKIYFNNKSKKVKRKPSIPPKVIELIEEQQKNTNHTEFFYVYKDPKTEKIIINIYEIKKRFNQEDRLIKRRITNSSNNCYAVMLQSKDEIKEIIASTKYKYSGLDILLKNILGKYNVITSTSDIKELMDYQELYNNNSNYEKIIKHPTLSMLTNNLSHLKDYSKVIEDGKSINEVFGLSPELFKVFENILNISIRIHPSGVIRELSILKTYQEYTKDKKGYSVEYLDYLFFMVKYREEYMEKIVNLIIEYNLKEKEIYNYLIKNYTRYLLPVRTTLNNWYDYLQMSNELNYNFENKNLLFPEDPIMSHDNASYAYNSLVKEYQEDIFKEKMDKIREVYSYSNDEFSVIVPEKTSDVVEEGATLRHCVKSYIDSIVRGKTNILFIRENKDLSKPYYTMEIKNNKVIQIRGFSNKAVDKYSSLYNFINEFKKEKEIY